MRKLLSVIILSCMCMTLSFAQGGRTTVSGKVTDAASGEPVIGASVLVKDQAAVGAITDLDGNYVLEYTGGSNVVVFSCIGYKDAEVTVTPGKKQTVNVNLVFDSEQLEETVVIGYGTVKKKDLSGAIGTAKGEGLQKLNSTTVSQSLQGAIPGLQVTRSSGLPGASATIRVRGVTTMGDSDPLIILDGVQISSLDHVNSSDIESITVLKDAASASIYGSRAAAGVILVTTKRPESGRLHVTYDGSFSVITPTKFPETVSLERFFEMYNEIEWNDGGNIDGNNYGIYSKEHIENYRTWNKLDPNTYPLTDWKEVLLKDWAPAHKHNVSVAYGNDVVRTNASVSYENTDALYKNRSYNVFHASVNNSVKIAKFLRVFADLSIRRAENQTPQNNPIAGAYIYGPNKAAYWADGRYAEGHNGNNPIYILEHGGYVNSQTYKARAKLGFDFEPVKNLVITGVFAPNLDITKKKDYTAQISFNQPNNPNVFMGYASGYDVTKLTEERNDAFSITKQLTANYNVTLGEGHNLSVMAGYEDYLYEHETMSATGDKIPVTGYPYLDRAPSDQVSVKGSATALAYMSYFGRIMYDYKHKYLLQANVRRDGSSRFHKDYRWGTFPSVSAGWVLTEEPWMAPAKKVLSFFKIRASYGSLGNERIGTYPYQAIMNLGNVLMDSNTGILSQMSAAQTAYNIQNITWETTSTWDIGVDATFFDGRLSANFDYYRKNTKDMLLSLEIPDHLGYSNPEQNAGNMHTNGWELSLGWRDKIGEFGYAVNANVSDYRSVMGNLSGVVLDGKQIIKEGSEYNEWYGYLSDGLYLTQEDLDNSAKLNEAVQVGDVKFKDIGGMYPETDPETGKTTMVWKPEPDGKITPEGDRTLLGGSTPRYVFGGNIQLDYKGFDLSLVFNGVGHQTVQLSQLMVFHNAAWQTFPSYLDGNYFSYYKTDEENAKARFPRLSQQKSGSDTAYNYEMSDFWFINGAYFRMKNITLGYTFPKAWMKKVKINNLRVYASVSDPFSIDNFPQGWDPEAATNAYIARTFNFGAQITF